MREIKFRAWDKDDNKLLYFGLFDLDTDYLLSQNKFIRGEVMQYTGLKDKNGVEIYEGDIVRKDGWSEPRDWLWVVKWLEEHLRFEPMGDFLVNCEVVGNIWENKELLEAEL